MNLRAAQTLTTLVPAPDVTAVELENELVLYQRGCAEVHVLNVTGSDIWDLVTRGMARAAVAAEIANAYSIKVDVALADVNELLSDCLEQGYSSNVLAERLDLLRGCVDLRLVDFVVRLRGPVALVDELARSYTVERPRPDRHLIPDAIFEWVTAESAGSYRLTCDGALGDSAAGLAEALGLGEWAINTRAVEYLGARYLLFHAGAVAAEGIGLLLPGASGSGKSTLVAGLIQRGFKGLGDDVAVVDPGTLQIQSFRDAVTVKRGSLRTLSHLYPDLATTQPRRRLDGRLAWCVSPAERSGNSEPVTARLVVMPRYARGAKSRLQSVPKSEALACLVQQSFSLRRHGAAGVTALVELLRDASCFALRYGTLGEAANLLAALVERERLAGGRPMTGALD